MELILEIKNLRSLFDINVPGAVIWDMDGVLAPTMGLHYEAMDLVLRKNGLKTPEEIYSIGTGRADAENLTYVLQKNGIDNTDQNFKGLLFKLIEEKSRALLRLVSERKLDSTPGVKGWLSAIQMRKIPCAVSSSSSMQIILRMIENLEFSQYFDVIISGANLKSSKPDPTIFLRTALALDVAPTDCLVIEDSPPGVEAAKRAGMQCIAIGTTIPLGELKQADIVLNNLSEYPPEDAF
jgi:beta-phosphoglucomutase